MMLRTLVRDSLSRNKAVGLGVGLGLGLALSCASVPHSFRGAVCKSSSTPDHAGKGGDLSGSGVDPGAKHDRADREEECTLREEVSGYESRLPVGAVCRVLMSVWLNLEFRLFNYNPPVRQYKPSSRFTAHNW